MKWFRSQILVVFVLLLVGCGPAKDADRKLVVELLNHGKVTEVSVWNEEKDVIVVSNPSLTIDEIQVTSVVLKSQKLGPPSWAVDVGLEIVDQTKPFLLSLQLLSGEYMLFTKEIDTPFERIFFKIPGRTPEELFPELAPTIAEIRRQYEETAR